jgi:poly(3-hydroxybutyrate) depolymerase
VKPSLIVLVAVGAVVTPATYVQAAWSPTGATAVRIWAMEYRAHDGDLRRAYVELPAWYGPRQHLAIPLVISPHGRGVGAHTNLRRWADLPALGRFAVVDPEGQGRRLTLFAWGDPGDIADLSKMPQFVHKALPWLRIDSRRIYAFGGSMGGQATLLLVAKYPQMLAGAAAFDAPTNMAARYDAFSSLPFGRGLQQLARIEIGGTPSSDPRAPTPSVARSTGRQGLRPPESRCRSGGARATGSSSTRHRNPGFFTAPSCG